MQARASPSANAKVVGTKSFGKGTVQETRSLSNGKTTKITIVKIIHSILDSFKIIKN